MKSRIYKQVHFDASHRLLHYRGKCANLHGHRWRVEVWIEGTIDAVTGIIVDYNEITALIDRFDHQILLNEHDPMVPCIRQFQPVMTLPADPTSEILACTIKDQINAHYDEIGNQIPAMLSSGHEDHRDIPKHSR
jgi:6-pyruvoyltetrahydropterin/6-carboxytetrahydropterin synthase